jgi:hypothetical protein
MAENIVGNDHQTRNVRRQGVANLVETNGLS